VLALRRSVVGKGVPTLTILERPNDASLWPPPMVNVQHGFARSCSDVTLGNVRATDASLCVSRVLDA